MGSERASVRPRIYVASATTGTKTETDGIYVFERNPVTGDVLPTALRLPSRGTSYLALHPSGRFLYATRLQEEGAIAAFVIHSDGNLSPLGEQSSSGSLPCHMYVHPSGRFVISANYGSGEIVVHPIKGDGSLGEVSHRVEGYGKGPNPERQTHTHAHFVGADVARRFLLTTDLGADCVRTYALSASTGRLRLVATTATDPGSGPRHLVAHPDGQIYVVGELNSTLLTMFPPSGAVRFILRSWAQICTWPIKDRET
jgi:6-phosphogluconolactonase